VRLCETCERKVFYCTSIREAQRHADAGECVAVSLTLLRPPGDVVFDHGSDLMGDLAVDGMLDDSDCYYDKDGRDPKDAG
jgi:hypothetical protein